LKKKDIFKDLRTQTNIL